jgi:3-deoxy-D-manno-octulosonic-acid transferase
MSEASAGSGPEAGKSGGSLAARLFAAYVRLVYRTSRLACDLQRLAKAFRDNDPFILAGWHGGFLLAPILMPDPTRVSAMVARHGDAELMGGLLEQFGVRLVRGAGAGGKRKDKGGAAALRVALRELRDGRTIAMTADVPPGPARQPGLGVITIARMSGRPIVPVVAATSRFFVLNTWSRFIVNLPFSRLAVLTGEPLQVPADADGAEMERLRLELQRRLEAIGREAYGLVGAGKQALVRIGAEGPPPPGLALQLYRRAMQSAEPLAGWILRRRMQKGKEDPARLVERMGRPALPRPHGFLVWVHAVSVGETNAVLPLIQRLRQDYPDKQILLTTGTLTSSRIAAERLPKGALHQFIPLDVPAFVDSFLDHWRPDLALFVESEIWPNLVLGTHAHKIPLVLLNGSLSIRSYRRWRRRPGMSRPLFGSYSLILTQTETLRQRFFRLGAPNVESVGNLKLDAPPLRVDETALARMREAVGGRPLWLAASTHAGEEEQVVVAHLAARERLPGLLTVIVPRHPERGGEVAALIEAAGLSVRRRSAGELPDAGTDIYLADTLGELGLFYALAPLALVGGSLTPIGGHNPIEAVRLHTAVVTGPHWFKQTDTFGPLTAGGGAIEVKSAEELAGLLAELLADPERLQQAIEAAERTTAQLTGALERTMIALAPYLAARDEAKDAA